MYTPSLDGGTDPLCNDGADSGTAPRKAAAISAACVNKVLLLYGTRSIRST